MRSFDAILKDRERAKQGKSTGGDFDRVKANRALDKIRELYRSYSQGIESYVKDYNSRYFDEEGNYVQQYRGDDHSDWSTKMKERKGSLSSQGNEIRSLLEQYGSYYDQKYVSGLKKAINASGQGVRKINSVLSSEDDFYSTYTTEDDYNKAIAQQKEYEELSTLDLEALKKDVDYYQTQVDNVSNLRHLISQLDADISTYKYAANFNADARAKLAELEDRKAVLEQKLKEAEAAGYDRALSELTRKYNRANDIQNSIKLTNDAKGAKDFDEKSGYVSTKKDDFWSRLTGNEYDKTYEYINDVDGMRSEIEQEHEAYMRDNPWSNNTTTWEEKGYDQLTADEVAIYNYYYATGGKEKAEEYLNSIQDALYNRRAQDMFAKIEDKPFLEVIFGVEAGLDQFASNIQSIFDDDAAKHTNATQQAAGMVREDLGTVGRVAFDFVTTTANMAPSLAIGGLSNLILPGSGGYVTNALMGISAGGGAYAQAIKQGYTEEQAKTYGVLVGSSEALLGRLLGSIGNAGNSLTGKVISKAVDRIDNGFAKFALDFGGNLASEALEEGLQEVLTPLFENIALNESNTWKDIDWGQVAYSALLGAMSAGLFEGPGTVINHVKYNSAIKAEGNRIVGNGGVDSLVALANQMAGVADGDMAGNLSAQVNKINGKSGVDAKAVGKLSFAVNDARVGLNKADIVAALEGRGISSRKAQKYADILASNNYELGTVEEWKKATGDSESYNVIRSVMDSSVNARNKQYGLARQGIKVNADGTMSLSKDNVDKVLKDNYAKQSEDVKSAVAEDGKTKVISTDAEVTLKGIDHIEVEKTEDGKKEKVGYVKVEDADGNESVVKVSDVKFASRSDAVLYDTFVAMDIDPAHFDAYIKDFNEADFDGNLGEAAMQYALGFRNAYRYGWANLETELRTDVYASKLTDTVRNNAYNLGKDAVTKQTEAKQKSLDTAVAERKASGKGKAKTKGKLHMDGVKTTKRTAMQNAGVGLAKRLTDLGIDVYVYESRKVNGQWVDENGNVAPNGYYRAKDGSIHIDLNAGEYGQGIMVYTLAHELTHFMRDKSPKQFKAFADLLVKWYGEKGETLNGLITKTMNDENLSWDDAYEEVIARSCESFLTDSNIADRILELQNTDKGLWETIRDKVLEFLKWMKSLFANVNPESYEGDLLHQYKSEIDHLYDAFYNTLTDAVETNQWAGSIAEAKTNAETLATAGITVDADTGSAVMNSVRYAPKTQAEIDKVSKALSESMGVSIEKAKAWVKSETSLASVILDPSNAMFLDYEADDRYEAIKKNAEYPQGTVDFSNLCKKRREFTALLDKLQKEHPNRIITAEEMEKIRQILIEENVEVACGLCYVEERRQLLGEIAQGFIDGYKNGTLKEAIAKELDGTDTYVPTIYDLITYDGYRALTTEHPSIAKAFQKFNNARGMQAGRLIEGIAEYKRDILNWSQKKVDFVNSVGGLRVFSFSDFEATHLIDLVQVVQDCAAKGVMIQAYTKVPAFANAVKDTNIKVNRSLIANGTGIKYENGRMVLDLDPVEGIDINDKDFFDSTNSESVGNVLVGMSDEQIRLAMKTPFVDYIIPFHTGLKKDILKAKKIDHWDNYKNFQTDKDIATGKVAKNQINVYVDVIQAAEAEGKPIKNKVDFVNKFLAVAKEKGLKPRFWNFLDVDANGEYTYTEGYHKFLVDFKLFDQQGNILPQKPVVPEFDDALNARILNEYVAGKKAPVSRDAVYDRLEREVINGEGVKKSSRNTGHSADNPYNVSNGENNTKEGLIRGESRQETREAFLRRAVQAVLQVKTRGKVAYGYRRTSPADVTERSRQAEEELKKLGVPSVVYDVLEENRDGVSSVVTSESTTIRGDAVYINNALIRDPKEVAGHEAYHFWKLSNERDVYSSVLEDNIIFSSNDFEVFVSEIADGYSLDDEIGSKQWETLMEEVYAYISGFIHSGDSDLVKKFILDFSEVEAAWNELVNAHLQNAKKSARRDSTGRTLTEAQQEFFKDSKVRDAEGNLLVVYHGTDADFTVFERKKGVRSFAVGMNYEVESNGFFFSQDYDFAHQYGRKIRPYYLDVKKPLVKQGDKINLNNLGSKGETAFYDEEKVDNIYYVLEPVIRDVLKYEFEHSYSRYEDTEENIKIKKRWALKDLWQYFDGDIFNDMSIPWEVVDNAHFVESLSRMSKLGYDGLMVNEGDGNPSSWFVPESNQAKLTTNLNPTKDPDIRYSRRVTAEQEAQYLELAKDPRKNKQALQEMVDEAAKKAGYPVKAYHGTSSFGFTKFDPAMSDDKTTLFFTDDIRVASTYAGRDISRTKSVADAKSFKYVKGKVYSEAELKEAHDFIQAKYYVYGETKINVDKQTVTHAGTRYSAKQIMEMADRIAKEGIYGVYLNTDNTLELDAGHKGWSGLKNPDVVRWEWRIKYQGDREFDYFKAKADDKFRLDLLQDGESVHSGDIQFSEMFSLLRKALGADRAETAIRNAINHDIGSSRFAEGYSDKNGKYINPTMNTREFAKYAKQKGYDGVVVKNLYDWGGKNNPATAKFAVDGGGASTVYILFDSNRVKSADPVTYDEQGNVIPLSERFDSSNDDIRYQQRGTGMSNRSILANALESATQHESEARRLAEYKAKIDLINSEEQKLQEMRLRIADLSFASGPKDTATIKRLQDTATRIANRINTYDKQLLNLEATAPLKALLEREKDMVRKREKEKAADALAKYREKSAETLREVMTRNTESRKRSIDSRKRTVVRNKIKRVVTDLNGMLNRGTKERNVKTDMQETVGSALKLANVLFNDEITNEDIVLMGSTMATEEEQKLLDQYADLIKKRDSAPVDEAMRYINKMSDLNRKLADLFKRERARLNQAKVSEAVDELAKAYANLKVSDKDYVNAYYSEEAHKRLLNLSESLGGTVMKDMSLVQLEEVYDAYKMIRHIVRESNSLFRMGKTQDLAKTVNSVQEQILSLHKEREKDPRAFAKKMGDLLGNFAWNEMKPLTAFETLGADAYTELFWDAIKAEGEWAKWMEEANAFLDEQRNKYGYKSWKMDEAHEFTLPDGKVFSVTLQDMLSIYAYSKREQAYEHMTTGGFQFDKNNAYKDKSGKKRVHLGDLYVTDWTTIGRIIGALTEEQKHYADVVQKYLTDMGKRGNEVSEILYGIGIFNETAYFPLMSAKDYRSSVEEALSNTQTQVSLKNTGMTKQTVPNASNPIILQGFDDVVIGHIDKMAKYCTHVLPIENLRRVFDSVSADDGGGYVSTKAVIEKVFGESAKKYFDQYITDLNGGVFVGGAESPTLAMFSKFKGTAVGASLSVVVQQPFAVIRAMDVISPKHFIFGNAGQKETKHLYDEIKKYAPIAIIKEMGGFDVGSSRTAREYLGVRTDKGLKRAVDKVNDVAMWGAGWADEQGWGIIWKAVKREVASENKFKFGTAEFYKACGERFTEVIVRTQVYDSVNSRSGYMRSKSELVKFATSFMGEPTTVINEAYLSVLKVTRARGKLDRLRALRKLGRTMGVLTASTVLTTAAKSLIYAMRDDEDDESLRDRWAYNFGNSLKGDLHPLNLVPYGRDIVSLFEGWDIERPDMTLIANVIDSYKKLIKDDAPFEEWVALFGDVSNLFGIPAKNVIRDVKGIFNLLGDIFDDAVANDMGGAFSAGWQGVDYTNMVKAENAFADGDYDEVSRIVEGLIQSKVDSGKTEKEAKSAVRSSFTSTYKKQYLEAYERGDTDEMNRIREFLYATGLYGKLSELDESLKKWREG